MARPRTPIGTFGEISYERAPGGGFRARTRYRDDDGKVWRVSATGATRPEAARNLKTAVSQRATYRSSGELDGNSSFGRLVDVWLDDLDVIMSPWTRTSAWCSATSARSRPNIWT